MLIKKKAYKNNITFKRIKANKYKTICELSNCKHSDHGTRNSNDPMCKLCKTVRKIVTISNKMGDKYSFVPNIC